MGEYLIVAWILDLFTHSLITLSKETPVIAMPPWNSLESGSIQSNDYKYYDSVVLVNYLADPDQYKCLLTHTLCAIKSAYF